MACTLRTIDLITMQYGSSLLYTMSISEPIRVKCDETLIEIILKYHLHTHFCQLPANQNRQLRCQAVSHQQDNITAFYDSVFGKSCRILLPNDNTFMSRDDLPFG